MDNEKKPEDGNTTPNIDVKGILNPENIELDMGFGETFGWDPNMQTDVGFGVEADMGFDGADDGNISMDFEGVDSSVTADMSDLFSGSDQDIELQPYVENDVVKTLHDYDSRIEQLRRVMFAPKSAASASEMVKLNQSEFPYLDEKDLAALKAILVDYAQDPDYNMKPKEEVAEDVLEQLTTINGWAPGMHKNEFLVACATKYDSFRKILLAYNQSDTSPASLMIKEEDLRKYQEAYRLNYEVFETVDKMFGLDFTDPNIRPDYSALGGKSMDTLVAFRKERGLRGPIDSAQLLSYVDNMMNIVTMSKILGLDTDDISSFTRGELLRRYILHEFTAGEYTAKGLSEKPTINSVLSELMNYFLAHIEIELSQVMLALVFVMTYSRNMNNDTVYSEAVQFVMGLHKYLYAILHKNPLINPKPFVMVSGVKKGETGYQLFYDSNAGMQPYSSEDILIDVIGNGSNPYVIPKCVEIEWHRDDNNNYVEGCLLVPPKELVQRVFELSLSQNRRDEDDMPTEERTRGRGGIVRTRGRLDNVVYRITPTFEWVNANMASSFGSFDMEAASTGKGTSRTLSPLLQTLLSYSNSFEEGVTPVTAHIAKTEDTTLFYTTAGDAKGGNVLALAQTIDESGKSHVTTRGNVSIDAETGELLGSAIYDDGLGRQNIFVDRDKFQLEEIKPVETSVAMPLGDYRNFVEDGLVRTSFEYYNPQLREVNKRLCSLNGLDYDMLLSEAVETMSKDLRYIIGTYAIDNLLAYRMLMDYRDAIAAGLETDHFILENVTRLATILLGGENGLKDKEVWDEDCNAIFSDVEAASLNTVGDVCARLDALNPKVVAIQSLSRSEVTVDSTIREYNALKFIPAIYGRLRMFEEYMVLLKIVSIVGDDIVPVLKKNSALSTAYAEVITADNIEQKEKKLKTNARVKNIGEIFELTRTYFHNTKNSSYLLLKHFLLERNLYGILTTMEESLDPELNTEFRNMCAMLGLPDGTTMSKISSFEFGQLFSKSTVAEACESNLAFVNKALQSGLLMEVSSVGVEVQTLAAFDMLCTYGTSLFNIKEEENLSDVTKYVVDMYSYAGSFFISYGIALDEVALRTSSESRATLFLEHPLQFQHPRNIAAKDNVLDLTFFAGAELEDFNFAGGLE